MNGDRVEFIIVFLCKKHHTTNYTGARDCVRINNSDTYLATHQENEERDGSP